MNDLFQTWQSQLRKGYLELCIMIALEQKESSYGFELVQLLKQVGLDLNEGTLYPLLNRMHKNGWLDSNWQTPAQSGHPRRFYQLSAAGRLALPRMLSQFRDNIDIVNNLGSSK